MHSLRALGTSCAFLIPTSYSTVFKVSTGADELAFSSGVIDIPLVAGQTEVRLALVQRGDVDTDAAFNLTAAFIPSGSSVASAQDTLAVTFDSLAEVTPNPGTTITLNPANAVTGTSGGQPFADWYAAGTTGAERIVVPAGYATTSVAVSPGGADVIVGAASADSLNTLASHSDRSRLAGQRPDGAGTE